MRVKARISSGARWPTSRFGRLGALFVSVLCCALTWGCSQPSLRTEYSSLQQVWQTTAGPFRLSLLVSMEVIARQSAEPKLAAAPKTVLFRFRNQDVETAHFYFGRRFVVCRRRLFTEDAVVMGADDFAELIAAERFEVYLEGGRRFQPSPSGQSLLRRFAARVGLVSTDERSATP